MLIKNNLNIDINAFIKVEENNRRGAGRPDDQGRNRSTIPTGEQLEVYFEDLPKNKLKIFLEFAQVPSRNGKSGVKVYPGTNPGDAHHFEFLFKGKNHEAVVHYDLTDKNDEDKKRFITDVDPKVEHPG